MKTSTNTLPEEYTQSFENFLKINNWFSITLNIVAVALWAGGCGGGLRLAL